MPYLFCSKRWSYNPDTLETPSRSPQGSKAKGPILAPFSPRQWPQPSMWLPRMSMWTLHLGWTLGVEWAIFIRYFGDFWGEYPAKKCGKWLGISSWKKLCWYLLKDIQGYQSCLEMFLDSRKQQYGFDLQPEKNIFSYGNGRKACLNKTCKARVAGRVKAQPFLQRYIRLGVWLHPCQYYRPSSDMPAVRHEFLSIYQMAWVKSGKDEQGRHLLVTTMLHPSMKILVPHRHIHRCERWRTAVWGSTGRVVPPKAGLSHPGMPRQAAGCRGAVEALRIKSCHVPPKLTKLGIRVTMASLDFPRDPNRIQSWWWNHPPNESIWIPCLDVARRMAPSASPLKLAEALLVMAARAGPGQAKIDEAGCVFSRQIWTKPGVLRTIYPTRIIGWTQSIPKQHWSAPSSIHPQLPLPGGGGQGGQKNQRMVVCCSLLDEKAKKKLLGKQRWCESTSICFTELPHFCKAVLVLKSYGVYKQYLWKYHF